MLRAKATEVLAEMQASEHKHMCEKVNSLGLLVQSIEKNKTLSILLDLSEKGAGHLMNEHTISAMTGGLRENKAGHREKKW